MGAGLKKSGTRAIAVVSVVCAALSPAALAAVGGVSAAERERAATAGGVGASVLHDAKAPRLRPAGPAVEEGGTRARRAGGAARPAAQ